jgi:hypothetical protein
MNAGRRPGHDDIGPEAAHRPQGAPIAHEEFPGEPDHRRPGGGGRDMGTTTGLDQLHDGVLAGPRKPQGFLAVRQQTVFNRAERPHICGVHRIDQHLHPGRR